MMMNYEFAYPQYLWLLVLLLPMIVWYVLREKRSHADLQFSSLHVFRALKYKGRTGLRHVLFACRLLVLTCFIAALARPQASNDWQSYTSEGIDIMLALDVSTSMLAQDFTPDRLEAAKSVATDFILERSHDQIGLVVFAGESFTQCPLTTDKAVLVNLIREVKSGLIEDGTAIGMGLSTAVNRLKDSRGKSKVIILLTDGVNNRGAIAPATAAELAKTFGIRVYTIGVGTYGEAPYPFQTRWGVQVQNVPVEIDEDILKRIAELTGGQYFRATDNNKLAQIYEEIDQLEKSKVEVKHFSKKQEKYFWFAFAGLLLLILESLCRYTLLRRIP